MGNKLRALFEDEEQQYVQKIKFKDEESYTKFVESITRLQREGKGFKAEGIESAKTLLKNGNIQYPLANSENIEGMYFYPGSEEIVVPIDVGESHTEMEFIRTISDNTVILKTKPKAVVELNIKLNKNEEKTVFSYNTHVNNAENMTILISEYERTLLFFNMLFSLEKSNKEISKVRDFFDDSIKYFKRINELGEKLGISVSPAELPDDIKNQILAEKLYLLLVEHEYIRNNDKIISFNDVRTTRDMEVNKEFNVYYTTPRKYYLFGKEFTVYECCCIFNAIISRIDSKENKVFLCDTDIAPMYRSISAFVNKEESEKECSDIADNIEKYRDAKTISELLEYYNR